MASPKFVCIWILTVGALTVRAQSAERRVGEAAGFVGGVTGAGAHPAAGFGFGVALSRYGIVAGELAYVPLGADVLNSEEIAAGLRRSRMYDFNIGVHVRFPVRDRIAPYVIAGGGILHVKSVTATVSDAGQVSDQRRSATNPAFHTGGGVRFYLGDRWGIRPEVKYYHSDRYKFARFTIGVIYQFP